MRRRDLLALLGGAAASWPLGAKAQQAGARVAKLAFLGALSEATTAPDQIPALKAGLAENGLVEGRNITIELFWAEGSAERMQTLAIELGRSDRDVIVTAGPQAIQALVSTGTRIPIVFAITGNAFHQGVVDSLAHPGHNVTGLSMQDDELEAKRVELLKSAVPAIDRLMILHDPSMGESGIEQALAAARRFGITPILLDSGDPGGFDALFDQAVQQGANGLAAMASPFLNFQRKRLVDLAAKHSLPSIWESASYVRDGGLLSYGPSFADMYRRSGAYVAKILKGIKPADLPVQQPLKFEIAINQGVARRLGVIFPQSVLLQADEVIE